MCYCSLFLMKRMTGEFGDQMGTTILIQDSSLPLYLLRSEIKSALFFVCILATTLHVTCNVVAKKEASLRKKNPKFIILFIKPDEWCALFISEQRRYFELGRRVLTRSSSQIFVLVDDIESVCAFAPLCSCSPNVGRKQTDNVHRWRRRRLRRKAFAQQQHKSRCAGLSVESHVLPRIWQPTHIFTATQCCWLNEALLQFLGSLKCRYVAVYEPSTTTSMCAILWDTSIQRQEWPDPSYGRNGIHADLWPPRVSGVCSTSCVYSDLSNDVLYIVSLLNWSY